MACAKNVCGPAWGALLLALATAASLPAAPGSEPKPVCGAPHRAEEVLFLRHQRALRGRDFGPSAQAVPATSRDVGEIAIIDASPDVLAPPNPFDLGGASARITPSPHGFSISSSRRGPEPYALERGLPLPLEDDDFAVVELPFEFPYYGERYRRAYVHSDGNLTFRYPEASSTPRNFSRAMGGPPRVAPLFRDLDPSRGGQVAFETRADSVAINWMRVPEYMETGIGARQSFQAVLHREGVIEFRYGEVTGDAVVGIFPGEAGASAAAVDWTAGSATPLDQTGSVAEVFAARTQIDEFGIVHAFYRNHDDAYDALVLFNDLDLEASEYSLAHAFTVRNEIQGIGEQTFDSGPWFGSPRRLSAVINMGAVSRYPDDIEAPVSGLPHASLLTVLAHEVGHRFLAYPDFLDPATQTESRALLGRQFSHWSFFFNSNASVLEGNSIEDHGSSASPRFETVAASQGYSPLDQYLMGLRTVAEVPPTFLVANPTAAGRLGNAARSPEVGVTFDGERKTIRADYIVAQEGLRRPDSTVSQRHFRYAFVLLAARGQPPGPASVRKLERLRERWLAYFASQLGTRATAAADLVKLLHLSTWPAGGVIAGSHGQGRVTIAEPRTNDLAVYLTAQEAIASVPAVVSIPAGKVQANFQLTGIEVGTTALTAEAAEAGYDRAVTRLAVRDGLQGLALEAENAEARNGLAGTLLGAPLSFRLRDANLVPYSGVTLEFAASAPGTPSIADAATDPEGRATIPWRLGDGTGVQRLLARVKGAPEISVTAQVTVAQSGPAFGPNGVVNAASARNAAQAGAAPGSLLTIRGSGLASETRSAEGAVLSGSAAVLPRELAGTRVHVNGVAAPLLLVSPSQVRFQIPYEARGPSLRLLVVNPFGDTEAISIPWRAAQPGIFPNRIGPGARGIVPPPIANPGGLPQAGGLLLAYCTGLGRVNPPGRTGFPSLEQPPQRVVARMEGWIDREPVPVRFSGLAPNEVGVYAVQLELPGNLRPGQHTLRIAVAGYSSNQVTFQSR